MNRTFSHFVPFDCSFDGFRYEGNKKKIAFSFSFSFFFSSSWGFKFVCIFRAIVSVFEFYHISILKS